MSVEDYDQPEMMCPKCKKEYPDFDGFGVVFCSPEQGGCGFCRHLGYDGVGDGIHMRCNFCGLIKSCLQWP